MPDTNDGVSVMAVNEGLDRIVVSSSSSRSLSVASSEAVEVLAEPLTDMTRFTESVFHALDSLDLHSRALPMDQPVSPVCPSPVVPRKFPLLEVSPSLTVIQ